MWVDYRGHSVQSTMMGRSQHVGGIIEVHHYFLASPLSTIPHLNSIMRLLKPGVHTFVKGSVATTFKAVKCIGFPQTIQALTETATAVF